MIGPSTQHRSGHAYPWDVLGDETFVDRVRELGLSEVTLAAAYHSVRAATPLHPHHQLVQADHAALYRPVREQAWGSRRLRPVGPGWMAERDPFAAAAERLHEAGIGVRAWVVLNHDSRLGRRHPDVAVVNCFGDRYPHALCPQHEEVRERAALLAAESVREVPLTGVLLEAWGQLGVTHASLHEKTDGAWPGSIGVLLSICCCPACRGAWRGEGLDPERVVRELATAVRALQLDPDLDRGLDAVLAPDVLAGLLRVRHRGFRSSREGAVDAVVGASGPPLGVSLFLGDDAWGGAPLASFEAPDLDRVDTAVQGAWRPGPGPVGAVRRLRAALPARVGVSAYLTVLPPAERTSLVEHAGALLAAGATGLQLYHLGLAGIERQGWMAGLGAPG